MERVELHCHSIYSKMDGIARTCDIVKFAEENNMPAVAVTDYGSVMAFPELEHATSKVHCNVKPLFGIEAPTVNDYQHALYNYKGQDCKSFVAVDVQTTGISPKKDSIIEIGAVRFDNGSVTDTFSTFVNPQRKIPESVVELTGSTDEMLATAPPVAEAVKHFVEFAGDLVLVSHNADFVIGFIKQASKESNITFEPTYIDTVVLSKYEYPNAVSRELTKLCEEIGIEVEKNHRSVDNALTCSKLYLKMQENITMLDKDMACVDEFNFLDFDSEPTYHTTVLIKDQEGKNILYDQISLAEQRSESYTLRGLVANRDHLLLGSGGKCGLLFRTVLDDKDDELIEEIAQRYDFIEVQPHTNNKCLVNSDRYPEITTEQDLINLNLKIIAIGEKLDIPVVATGDVHYINQDDMVSRKVLRSYAGFMEDDDADLHFRTTQEMLDAFAYLGKEKAEEIVIKNSNMIADMCQEFDLLPDGKVYPKLEKQEELLRNICLAKAEEKFGKPIPSNIMERMEWELEAIRNSETEFSFIFLHNLLEELLLEPFEINTRGCAGNLLISFLLGITDFSPIEYNLSPVFAFGIKKDREVDIDVNFSKKMQQKAFREYFAKYGNDKHKLYPCTEAVVSEEGVSYAIREYEKINEVFISEDIKKKIIKNLTGAFREKYLKPDGLVLIPEEETLYGIMPLALSEDITAEYDISSITYFNYSWLKHCLFKQNILHYVALDMLEELENETGKNLCELTYEEPEIMSLFTIDDETESLCSDLPEYCHMDSRTLLKQAQPKNFNELVKVYALKHGKGVWTENAEQLLEQGKASLSDVIATRDDVFDCLIEHGIDEVYAFTIAEQIRKGEWAGGEKKHTEYMNMMREAGIPEWYICSCNKIGYLFPRAHAISAIRVNWRLAWYKVNFPKTYKVVADKYLFFE